MALPVEFIEKLKAANPIAETMGNYVSLKRVGRDYVCLCPFHNEKTPSCYVHPDKEYFHCFGCGAGGDVITFTMKYNNLDYWDAVKLLADKAGLPLPEDRSGKQGIDRRKRVYEMNKAAARFFYSQLKTPEGRVCLDYLINKRKLTIDTIKKYGMGFAPKSWTALLRHMTSLGYSEQELESASLVGRSGRTGNPYDFFVYRAMFPFFDLAGHIVGFGRRALDNEDKRKYLNSKDTICYNKNKFLFSMNFAKDEAVKTKKILLCEGNLDVISLNQHGFGNAVASCGTALTNEQAKLISNYAEEVVICYDSDAAGQKATQRAIGILRQTGLRTSVIKMEGAKDPDEYINKFGADHFKYLLGKSDGAVVFELNKCKEGLDLNEDVGKVEYLQKAYRVLAALESPVEREIYINRVADEQGVSRQAVMNEVEGLRGRARRAAAKRDWQRTVNFANVPKDEINPQANAHPKEAKAECGLIYYIYTNPDRAEDIGKRLPPEEFVTDFNRRVYKALLEKISSAQDSSVSSFNDEFTPDEVGKITGILDGFGQLGIDGYVADEYINTIKKAHSKSAVKSTSPESQEDFLRHFEELKKQKG